jgi:Fe-Mn family superoxide dismutase
MTKYVLPDLAYDYGALEPHISAKVLELHHDKHHRAYVEAANETIEALFDVRATGDFEHLAALERKIAFNVSGHILHSIFWRNLSPDGGGEPTGELAAHIERDFGGFDAMKRQMIEAAVTTMGSGWSALVFEPVSRRLGTVQIHDHQNQSTHGAVPLLVIDAWEHAYYLQYQTEKKKFFEAVWNVFDWEDVARRYEAAQSATLCLDDAASGVPPGDRPGAGMHHSIGA